MPRKYLHLEKTPATRKHPKSMWHLNNKGDLLSVDGNEKGSRSSPLSLRWRNNTVMELMWVQPKQMKYFNQQQETLVSKPVL